MNFFNTFRQSSLEDWCKYVGRIVDVIHQFPSGYDVNSFAQLGPEQTVKCLNLMQIPAMHVAGDTISIAASVEQLKSREKLR